jgi:RimJ/RimL family protein N-acetyltransferase
VIRVQASPPQNHKWLAERAGLTLHPGFMAFEAVDETGRIVGMVGFDGILPGAICLHGALDSPAALRRLLRPAFGAVFEPPPRGFGKVAAIATVLSTNTRSLKLVQHLGFRHAYTGRDWSGKGVDFVYFEMRREDCRFIPRALRRAA